VKFLGQARRLGNEVEIIRVGEVLREPQERLVEVVVGLGRDVEVLKTLLAVEGNLLALHLAVGGVDLVADQHAWDVIAHAGDVAVPVWYVLVRGLGGYIEHNDSALTKNVVAVAQAAEFLLTSGVPHVKEELASVGGKVKGMDFNADRSDVALLKFAGQMALHEGGLTDTTVAYDDQLEFIVRHVERGKPRQ